MLHALDDHLDMIFFRGFLEERLRQTVAFRVEGIPLAVNVDAVATLHTVFHQSAFFGVFRGSFGCGFRRCAYVLSETRHVHHVTRKLDLLMRQSR